MIPCRGNRSEVNREQWGTYQGKGLCQRAQRREKKRLNHAWAESDHIVVHVMSDTLGSMTEFFVEDWRHGAGADNGNSALVEASERALRRWDARLTLAVWRAAAL